jgi:hypothetical protein
VDVPATGCRFYISILRSLSEVGLNIMPLATIRFSLVPYTAAIDLPEVVHVVSMDTLVEHDLVLGVLHLYLRLVVAELLEQLQLLLLR